MIRTHRRALLLALVLVGAAAHQAHADFYHFAWQQTGVVDVSTQVVLNSQQAPLVAGAHYSIPGQPPADAQVATAAKVSTAGQLQWRSPAYPTLQLDHVMGADVDANDNLYIGGETYRYGSEAFLVKYNSFGGVQWERHLGSPDNEFGRDVAVDAAGNAYLLGSTTGIVTGSTHTGYDAFIAKYSPAGSLLMLRQYPDNSVSDIPTGIAVTSDSMYVVGPQGTLISRLARLDAAGDVVWTVSPDYATFPGFSTQLYDVAVDSAGNIYTCGMTDTYYDIFDLYLGGEAVLAKHAPDGQLLWQRRIDTGEYEQLNSIAFDNYGDVYVAGSRTNSYKLVTGDRDPLWAKFTPDGDLLWKQVIDGPQSQSGASIDVDSNRNVYLASAAANGNSLLTRYNYAVPEPAGASLILGAIAGVAALRRVRS